MMAVAAAYTAAGFTTHRGQVLVVENGGRRKATERMMTTLRTSRHDDRALRGTLRRLSNESRPMQMQILQQLLDEQDLQLALPMYKTLIQKDWYKWSPAVHARMVALLASEERAHEAEVLNSGLPGRLSVREKLALQVCLIESYAKYGLLDMALVTFRSLQAQSPTSVQYLSYRALLRAYISLDLPHKACLVLEEMRGKDFQPCLDDYKALLAAFGRATQFSEMERIANDIFEAGLELDQAGFNMMLSAYGQAGRFDRISTILTRMKSLDISCSVNTHNAISKSCPTLIPYFESLSEIPQNAAFLCSSLQIMGSSDGELEAVRELLALELPPYSVKWERSVWELDLHNMFQGTASTALCLWLHQLRARCSDGEPIPLTVRVVTGWGKHSDVEGRPVLKQKVLELLERMQAPFRIDSQNRGVLISRGSSLKKWLTSDQITNGF